MQLIVVIMRAWLLLLVELIRFSEGFVRVDPSAQVSCVLTGTQVHFFFSLVISGPNRKGSVKESSGGTRHEL